MHSIYAVEFDRELLQSALMEFLNNPEAADYQQIMQGQSPVRFEDEDNEEEQDNVQKDLEYGVFYRQYLKRFYPKVYVIRSLFEQMSPEAMAQGLVDIVSVFSDKTWFYFMDSHKNFKPANYWEYVIDQCALLSEFFRDARIDLQTYEILINIKDKQKATHRADGTQRKTKNLFLYLKEHHKQPIADFYALCFDYVLKLFNEGILLKDLVQANKYQDELEFIMGKLRNTLYEPEYQESIKTCKELIELLKEKKGDYEMDLIEEFFGDDEGALQFIKESLKNM